MRKLVSLVVLGLVLIAGFSVSAADEGPADVYVDRSTNVLMVKKSGEIKYSPFIIKGVNWSPATKAPKYGAKLDGSGYYRGDKFIPFETEYGFFGGIEGKELLNGWLRNELFQHYKDSQDKEGIKKGDITLIKEMNTTAVRISANLGSNLDKYEDYENKIKEVLDEFYAKDIMVILTVALDEEDISHQKYKKIVNSYKDHPAILMWVIGDEWNFNKFNSSSWDLEKSIKVVNTIAGEIQAIDTHHPVCSVLASYSEAKDVHYNSAIAAERLGGSTIDDISAILKACSNIDVWGVSIYNGDNFGDLFEQWGDQWNRCGQIVKPFFISAFGVDSFCTNAFKLYGGRNNHLGVKLADQIRGQEDQETQAMVNAKLWREIVAHLATDTYGEQCLGGLVSNFNDELWRVGNKYAGIDLKKLDSYKYIRWNKDTATSYDDYNYEGFVLQRISPDSNNPDKSYIIQNVEWLGVVTADRVPKLTYTRMQEEWMDNAVVLTTPVVTDTGEYTDNSRKLSASWTIPQGAKEFKYRITEGGIDRYSRIVVDWKSVGESNSVDVDNLNLVNGVKYYFSVKAINEAGSEQIGYSDGITIDTTPIITKFNKQWVVPGSYFIIRGNDFGKYNSSVSVRFIGNSDAANAEIRVWRDDYIFCVVLKIETGEYTVTITNSTGKKIEGKEKKVNVSKNVYVTGLNPSFGKTGEEMKVQGSNFGVKDGDSKVYIYDRAMQKVECEINSWCDWMINIVIPKDISKSDYYRIRVETKDGKSYLRWFYIYKKDIRIYSMSPSSGVIGQYVTLYGMNFGNKDDNSKVYLYDSTNNKIEGNIVEWKWSNYSIVFKIPEVDKFGIYKVKVETKNGMSNLMNLTVRDNSTSRYSSWLRRFMGRF